jgi:hypothetical protein
MSLLLYASTGTKITQQLKEVIKGVVPEGELEVFHALEIFKHRIRQPRRTQNIVIFCPSSKKELNEILMIQDLLADLPILLVLPDRDMATISKAHMLGPRFLTYADSNFSDLKAVLTKIAHRA